MTMRGWRGGMAAVLLAAAAPAWAHGLLMTAEADGAAVTGRVYYSDGTSGAGQSIELRDLSQTDVRPVWINTDAKGTYRFAATPGHRYAVVAHGEEGHMTEIQLTVGSGENGRLVDQPDVDGAALPPAWAVIGGLLLLSVVVAIGVRFRRPSERSGH